MVCPSIIGSRAHIPNPALAPLSFLIGDWRTTGRHPLMPGKELDGRTSFHWHEGGAYLIMRNEVDHPQFPDGVAIFGSDDKAGRFSMIYFDQRGTSRVFDVTVGVGTVTWRREDPHFAQMVTITAGEDDRTLISKGLMSQDGDKWTDDLSQTFRRPRLSDEDKAPASTG